MSDKSNVRVVDMNAEDLRAIVREESDAVARLMGIIDGLPPLPTGVAAKLLGRTTKTVNLWRKSGKLVSIEGGKIPLSEIIRIKMNKAS